MNRIIIFLIVLLFILNNNVIGQDYSKNSLKYGFGINIAGAGDIVVDGAGLFFTFGYQREIWKDRLRLNPNFSYGVYSSRHWFAATPGFYNSLNIGTNFYFDLIKIKAFSIFIGIGGFYNYAFGAEEGVNENYDKTLFVTSHGFAYNLGGGFRINTKQKRIAIEVIPCDLLFRKDVISEQHFIKLGLDIKL